MVYGLVREAESGMRHLIQGAKNVCCSHETLRLSLDGVSTVELHETMKVGLDGAGN